MTTVSPPVVRSDGGTRAPTWGGRTLAMVATWACPVVVSVLRNVLMRPSVAICAWPVVVSVLRMLFLKATVATWAWLAVRVRRFSTPPAL